MFYIYKITNILNGKIYIGKTTGTIENRWKQHKRDAFRERNQNRPLYSAIRKYGIDNFIIEKVEEVSTEKILNDREIYWIKYYNTYKNGYNATLGGDGKILLDYNYVYNIYLSTKTIKETASICKCSQETVAKIIKKMGVTNEEIFFNGKVSYSKKVAMINKNTNEIIKVFNSAREAGRYINKGHQHISDVCKGKRKTAYGYKWQYL